MKTLHGYLIREIITATLATIAILTFVLVIGNIFTRIFDLLINNDVPFDFLAEFVLLLIPFSLVFTLPWGLLTAVILVFGRLSADSELVAIRASGVSLSAFLAPVLLLAVGCSLVCLAINCVVAPYAQDRIKSMAYTLAVESPTALFDDDSIIDQFPDKRIYVGRKSGEKVFNLHVWDLDDKNRPLRCFRAEEGSILADSENNSIIIKLRNARMEERNGEDLWDLSRIQLGRRFDELPLTIPLGKMMEKANKRKGLGALSFEQLVETVATGRKKRADYPWSPLLTEIQKRVAASMSCLTFVMIGIPLAIRSHRKETSIGIALSFGVVFLYYFLIIVAETFKTRPGAFPELIIWAPNLIFQIGGLLALLRVCRS